MRSGSNAGTRWRSLRSNFVKIRILLKIKMISNLITMIVTTLATEVAAWSKLLRENFVICLLTFLYASAFIAMLHSSHDLADKDNLGFVREVVTGIGGCLFGLLTGNRLAGRGAGEPTASTTTTTTVQAIGGPVPPVPPIPPVLPITTIPSPDHPAS